MLHMVLNQLALGVADRTFDGMDLLSEVKAGTPFLQHGDDRGEMTVSAFQPLEDFGMGSVFHCRTLT
jgi:hypothetical protein